MSTITLVGSTVIGNTATSVALPAGTLPGDHLILVIGSGWLAGSDATCTDSRMSVVFAPTGSHVLVAYGVATSSTAPLTISVSDGESNGQVVLMAFRAPAGSAVATAISTGGTTASPSLPAGTSGAAAIAALATVNNYGVDAGALAPAVIDSWGRLELAGGSAIVETVYATEASAPFALAQPVNGWIGLTVTITPPTPPPPPPPYDYVNGEDVPVGSSDDGQVVVVTADDTQTLAVEVIADNIGKPGIESRIYIVEVLPEAEIILVFFHLDGGSPSDSRDRFFDGGSPGDSATRSFNGGAP